MSDIMNILLVSDENYAILSTVLMTSILENSSNDFDEINIFLLNNNITENSLEKIKSLKTKYEKLKLHIINKSLIEEKLINIKDELPTKNLSYFYRLFMTQILPDDIEKILYMDSDIIVDSSLVDLYNEDIDNVYCAGIIDINEVVFKELLGMKREDYYINSGVLLVNFQKWLKEDITGQSIDFINSTRSKELLYDQHIINYILKNNIKILEPKFNVLTHMFTLNYERFMSVFRIRDGVFTKKEYLEAQSNPSVIHYIGSPWRRPWELDCKHPKQDLFFKYKDISPYSSHEIKYKSLDRKTMIKSAIVRFVFTYFPVKLASYMNKKNILNLRWFVT
ncbi:MAG: glycosyltransferase family 8 protein [Methanobrevibacter sp.]|jgi:lipopolysaccharide biosynthesis glycosyltransferase|nr:glycosyltransferase family 8 protein [Candidatus Methanovirga basalitermitum]